MLRRTLWIEPANGLCNRLRAADSALQLAQEHGYRLHLAWNLGAGMNCSFDRLFRCPEGIDLVWHWSSFSRLDQIRRTWHKGVTKALHGLVMDQPDVDRLLVSQRGFDHLVDYSRIYIRTASRFYGDRRFCSDWIPQSHIEEQVEELVSNWHGHPAVGVHVRRGDHHIARQRSPISSFVAHMERVLERDPRTLFFVATDDIGELEMLRGRFGERVLSQSKSSVTRSEPRAIESALVDLLTLARTGRIIGSLGSSFSETAANIGDIVLEIASDNCIDG